MAPKRVIIKASDVAACIGRHRYKPRDEVLNDMWKKYWPETFTGQTKTDRAEKALGASVEARQVLQNALDIRTKDSTQVQKVFDEAQAKVNLDSKLSAAQKAEIIEHVRSQVYTTHGTRNEDRTADAVTETEGARLVRDETFWSWDVCVIDGIKFVISGRIDRIEERPDGSRVLVEIKNRTNRLFRSVPEYEHIQIQVYLHMLGLVHARLVEQYNTQVLSHDVTRDEELWDNVIIPGLEQFCQEIYMRAKN